MKELYTSPELELLRLAAQERLANNQVEFDDMLGGSGGGVSIDTSLDVDVPILPGN